MSQPSNTNATAKISRGSKLKTALSKPSWRVAFLLGLVAFGMGATLSLARWPVPFVHDEFSYLLAADTFCEGRLTNPTHPFWEHFESFHIIMEPSYSSKYPPGQGLFLALGQRVTGHAIAGIWFLSALAAAACYWMLLGWVPPRWAAAGGLIFIFHPGYQLLWGQTYYGGTLGFLGGALVCGAAARLVERPQISSALAMGLGTILLAVSRPYEGFVFCLLCGALVLVGWYRQGWPKGKPLLLQTIVPMTCVLLLGGLALAKHNKSVTGNFTTLPYQVHERTYTIAPLFLWQGLTEVGNYRHKMIAEHHHGWMMDAYHLQNSLPNLLQFKADLTEMDLHFFLPLPLAICSFFLILNLWQDHGNSKSRFWYFGVLVVVILSWFASMLTAVVVYPHYMAPLAPLLLLISVWGLRYATITFRRIFPSYNRLWLPLAFLVCEAALLGHQALTHINSSKDIWSWQRENMLAQLETTPKKHLIFVRYNSTHNPRHEWVYNRADIDRSQVAWAREIDPANDQALADYFHDRKIWLLEADQPNPTLQLWQPTRRSSHDL
ncbi:MAG: hypothetical protein GXP24_12700 [Planctomycetes bacterium]|nr:hypothetical protein [Planctomycetota bacterium]